MIFFLLWQIHNPNIIFSKQVMDAFTITCQLFLNKIEISVGIWATEKKCCKQKNLNKKYDRINITQEGF